MATPTQPVKKSVILKPRVTEKAALQANKSGIYAFEVSPEATAKQVIASIKLAYKVTPIRVSLLAIPRKKVFRRGKPGVKGGGKKAYVYLKKGDKIDVI